MGGRIDLLNRENFVGNIMKLINQLSANQRSCCFAIEGSWGIGKTYILEEIEKQIDSMEEKFFLFHYNCWQYDYYEEPSVGIISAMIYSIQEDQDPVNEELKKGIKAGYEVVAEKLKDIAGAYIENKIGINLISWVEETKQRKEEKEEEVYEFDKMFNFSQTIEKVRKDLQEIAQKRTIVLVVDELDRCIPQYAIKVLERLHHIFDGLLNVIVIIAIDRVQLEHSVEEMFGIKESQEYMGIEKYLKKFIDFSMVLDHGEINNLFMDKYEHYFDKFSVVQGSGDLKEVNKIYPQLFKGIDIRIQEKIIEKAHMIHSIICNDPVDISVCVFEILYLVLEIWQFDKLKYLAGINDAHYSTLEERVGADRMDLLKSMEKAAWNDKVVSRENPEGLKCILYNLYGKVFWYFSKIFNKESMPYEESNMHNREMEMCLKIATQYCEYCNFIK